MQISSIINRKGHHFECVSESIPLIEAVETMHRNAIGSIGILGHGHEGLIGIVSQNELMAGIAERGMNCLQLPVLIFARRSMLVCQCQDDVASLMQKMTLARSRHAVVHKPDGSIAGLVSMGDLVAALLEEAQLEAGVLRDMARSRILAGSA